MIDLFGDADNLLDPLTFTEAEIGIFLNRHRCAVCLGHLESKHHEGRRYTAFCPVCKHVIIEDNHVSAWEVESIKGHRAEGAHELRTERMKSKPRRKPEDIIKELYGG